jgi:hypothetical protein
VTNIHAIVFGDQRADFGMPGRVRVPSVRALAMTDAALTWGAPAAVIADTKGDFSGFHAWSPPS